MRIADDMILEDREIRERFVRAIGSRHQNARKEATAVELRVNLCASSLPRDMRERLVALAGRSVTRAGVLVVVSRAFRSQADNRAAARGRLLALLRRAAKAPTTRAAGQTPQTERNDRMAGKKSRGGVKQLRARPRGTEE